MGEHAARLAQWPNRFFEPLRRPGCYNLQNFHTDHDAVGASIAESVARWLNAEEVIRILDNEDSLIVSKWGPRRRGVNGLYLCVAPNGYRDPFLGVAENGLRQRLTYNGFRMSVCESIGLLDDSYRKRVHRRIGALSNWTVVHYRHV